MDGKGGFWREDIFGSSHIIVPSPFIPSQREGKARMYLHWPSTFCGFIRIFYEFMSILRIKVQIQ
jgi:hypothetical protein